MTQPNTPPDRLHEVVTTGMDTLAALAVSAGVMLALRPAYGWGGGMIMGGFLLFALSLLAQFLRRQRPEPQSAAPTEPDPPGPEDPGNVHVMGR